jgi:ammonia channel protein AmtB
MQLGFAMMESGMCRQVNVIATYAKNMLDFTFGALASLLFGCEAGQ